MKRFFWLILTFFLSLPGYSSTTNQHLIFTDVFAHQILDYTNQYRKSKGLSSLSWNQSVANVSHIHSMNMARKIVPFSHQGFKKRINAISPKFRAAAENVYMANSEGNIARACVDAWIKSSGHKKNLLGNYTHCGIGIVKNSQGYWYITQIFINNDS